MKKVILVLVLVSFVTVGTVFADHPSGLGIGVVGSYNYSYGYASGGSAGLSLKVPALPIFWGINAGFGTNYFSVHVTGDGYLFDSEIIPTLGWFLGIGGYFSFYSHSGGTSYTSLAVGGRIPVGLSWQPLDLIEVFLDVAPSFGLGIGAANDSAKMGFDFFVPVEIGLRIWL